MKRNAMLTAAVMVLQSSLAQADVVVERWGAAGRVQHPGTLKYSAGQGAGVANAVNRVGVPAQVAGFDLKALPAKATIHRARLLMARLGGYAASFEVFAPGASAKDKPSGKPLTPVPPYCRWFDVTKSVRAQVRSGRSATFLIAGSGYDPKATRLEIAHEGRLAHPPKQVGGVKAFHRAGQVFITFTEIADLTEGRDRYSWGHLIKKTRGYTADGIVPNDAKGELRYRVYRHDKPITPKTIGRADLLAEVVPASGVNTRIVKRIWQGENVPSKLDDKFVAVRLAVEPGQPVPSGTGVYVHTVARAGKAYYAVVTAVDGVENTTDLSGAVAGPIDAKPAPPEPVLQDESVARKGRADELVTRRYALWAAPPLSERPLHYRVTMQWYPKRIGKPAPLEVNHGHSHAYTLQRRQRADAYMLVPADGAENAFYVGANNCHTTLKSFAQGDWAPWTYRRIARIVEWAKAAYPIDDQQIYAYGSHWGMWYLRHPEIYSVFIGWGSAEYTKGFLDWNRARGTWGPPSAYKGKGSPERDTPRSGVPKPDEANPYVMCDFTRYVQADPARRMPVQFLIPCTGSHTSEMSYAALPRYKSALMDARQPFAADIGKASWGFATPVALSAFRAGRLVIRRDDPKPAFGRCTLDDNHGSGDIRSGEPKGLLNGYLLWETDGIVDEPGRFEMTVVLHASAPLDRCGVDFTPRHCRKFKPRPGQKFTWTVTPLPAKASGKKPPAPPSATGKPTRGEASADKFGLVTLKQIILAKGRNRVVIRAKG